LGNGVLVFCHKDTTPTALKSQVPHKQAYLGLSSFEIEIDFYPISNGQNYKCEVKLMGKGNPESADAVINFALSCFLFTSVQV